MHYIPSSARMSEARDYKLELLVNYCPTATFAKRITLSFKV